MFENLPLEVFERRTGLNPNGSIQVASQVVSMRDLVKTTDISIMSEAYLKGLLSNIVLEGDKDCKVYRDCDLTRARIDPHNIEVGQTFVERPKYRRILENLPETFEGFCVNHGFAKCNALIIRGYDAQGNSVIAHYVPPIIEMHNDRLFLLDGVHRNFLTMAVGTTVETIILRNVRTPFPCDPRGWDQVTPVEVKPPRPERFRNLRTELFRDLKWVGIDG
jgi:hypothetical protein